MNDAKNSVLPRLTQERFLGKKTDQDESAERCQTQSPHGRRASKGAKENGREEEQGAKGTPPLQAKKGGKSTGDQE